MQIRGHFSVFNYMLGISNMLEISKYWREIIIITWVQSQCKMGPGLRVDSLASYSRLSFADFKFLFLKFQTALYSYSEKSFASKEEIKCSYIKTVIKWFTAVQSEQKSSYQYFFSTLKLKAVSKALKLLSWHMIKFKVTAWYVYENKQAYVTNGWKIRL